MTSVPPTRTRYSTRSPRYSTSSTTPAGPAPPGDAITRKASGRTSTSTSFAGHAGSARDAMIERLHGDMALRARHDSSRQRVDLADEIGGEETRRTRIDLLRRAHLLHASVVHDHDAIGQTHGLVLVVRHVNGRRAEALLQAPQFAAHLHAQLGVEVGQRFVEQQQVRLHDQCTRQRDALLLAARELARETARHRFEAYRLQRGRYGRNARAGPDLCGRAANTRRSRTPTVRKQRVILEHHADAPAMRRQRLYRLPIDQDFACVGAARIRPACAARWSCRSPTDRET